MKAMEILRRVCSVVGALLDSFGFIVIATVSSCSLLVISRLGCRYCFT